MLDSLAQQQYITLLQQELIPAMGCTDPVALAYAAAKAASLLDGAPEKIIARCSGNLIKNARCVSIPHSGGLVGIEAAVALGAFGGDADLCMEVLKSVDEEGLAAAKAFVAEGGCQLEYLDSPHPLHFMVEVQGQNGQVTVEVRDSYTNIISIVKNGDILFSQPDQGEEGEYAGGPSLSVADIKHFADHVDIEALRPIYDKQVQCNMDIAYEGMTGKYGLGIGHMILSKYPDSTVTQMKAYAAAASEARMGGCDLPVVINSGSGNQGIASSVPVIVYARQNGIGEERLYRALAFSSLLAVHQKQFIGKLSAFCGAVSASCAAGAAITYLAGGTIEQITDTIGNTLANISGVFCDGAKVSCAAKIASSIDASMMGHYFAMDGKAYQAYSGILKNGADETIRCVGHIAKDGMRQTDREIIKALLQ